MPNDGIKVVEDAAKDLNTLASSNQRQALELSEKIKAHNPNTLPRAKVEADTSFNSDSTNATEAITAGKRYQPNQAQALTLDKLKLPAETELWEGGKSSEPYIGKVRTNLWLDNGTGIMIARDTTSALDIPNLCDIPGKGCNADRHYQSLA